MLFRSLSFSPRRQSAPENLLAGYFLISGLISKNPIFLLTPFPALLLAYPSVTSSFFSLSSLLKFFCRLSCLPWVTLGPYKYKHLVLFPYTEGFERLRRRQRLGRRDSFSLINPHGLNFRHFFLHVQNPLGRDRQGK